MRLHTLLLSLLLTVFAASALAESGQKPIPKPLATPQPEPAVAKLCKSIYAALADDGDSLQKKLGRADKLEEVPLPNRHHPNINDLRVMYRYGDGLVSYYTVPSMEKTYLEAAVFTKSFWPKSLPKMLGKSSSELLKEFGKPDDKDKDRIAYTCSYDTNDSVNFLLKSGKVYRMVLRNVIE